MKTTKPSNCFAAAALILSLTPMVHAQSMIPSAVLSKAVALQKYTDKDVMAMKLQAATYLSSILNVNPMQVVQTKQVDPLTVNDLSQLDTTNEEMKALSIWADMINKGTLKPNVIKLIAELKSSPTPIAKTLQATPQAQLDYAVNSLVSSIEGTVKLRGMTNDSKQVKYHEWSALSKIMTKKIDNSVAAKKDLLDMAKSTWIRTKKVEVLVNGEKSFERRDALMSDAKKSINILTWSIYDDQTGTELVDLLLKKKQENPNLEIRVIVDGQVAATSGHGAQVKRLEDAKVEVIRWFNKDLSYVGQHRKMLIVDDQAMVAGGLNFGDVYSHKNPKSAQWRDTDIYVEGAGAEEGNRLFAKIWNDQLKSQPKLKHAAFKPTTRTSIGDAGGAEISLINHNAAEAAEGSTIMLTLLKAIREAKSRIDIENAYIILFPALKQEITSALARGVNVRVYTNSAQSVDEPIVSIPILRSVSEFIKMKAQVFVKKGDTLHSKLVVIDDTISFIMSYNLHPRSERVEGEMAILVRDQAFAATMHKVVDDDLTTDKATELRSAADLKMPTSAVSVPTLRLFFDML